MARNSLIIIAALASFCVSAEASERLLFHKDLPPNARIIVTPGAARVIVHPRQGQEITAYDRSGKEAWQTKTDSCLVVSQDGGRAWVNQGTRGVILDAETGKRISRSKKLIAHAALSDEDGRSCPTFTPEGKHLHSCAVRYENDIFKSQKGMLIDAEAGKILWEKQDICLGDLMPRGAGFSVGRQGIVSIKGEIFAAFREWANPLTGIAKENIWRDPGTRVVIDSISGDGRAMLGFEYSDVQDAIGKDDSKYYVYTSADGDGKTWAKKMLNLGTAARTYFAPDDKRFLAVMFEGDHVRRPEPLTHLYFHDLDGSLIWEKTVNHKNIAKSVAQRIYVGGWPGIKYEEEHILIDFKYFTDVYDLSGKLVKRIDQYVTHDSVKDHERKSGVWLLDDGSYVRLEHRRTRREKDHLSAYIGELDERE